MNDIAKAVLTIKQWLARHDIDARDAKITIELPTDRAEYRADMALRSELSREQLASADVARVGSMFGFKFEFTSPKRRAAE